MLPAALLRLTRTSAPRSAVLIRVAVGAVFLSEGIQKLVFPGELGTGRFVKIGIPLPEMTAPVVAAFEIGCGALVLLGLFTRLAAAPLIAVMLVAISSTKIPILSQSGFWKMAHEARTDLAMLLGAPFLLVSGAGPWSLDARMAREREKDGS
jgi:putative oxidoreductase